MLRVSVSVPDIENRKRMWFIVIDKKVFTTKLYHSAQKDQVYVPFGPKEEHRSKPSTV